MSKILGQQGEAFAAEFLIKQGYEIMEQNYRCILGEVDIIAKVHGVLCFVEVKARSTDKEQPFEAIHQRKQYKLTRLAQYYLKENFGHVDVSARFDVVAVYQMPDGTFEAELLQNAFESFS